MGMSDVLRIPNNTKYYTTHIKNNARTHTHTHTILFYSKEQQQKAVIKVGVNDCHFFFYLISLTLQSHWTRKVAY
jgi:hypothetical protein